MSTPRRLSLLFAACIALAAATPARAGLGVWTPAGPDGATVTTLGASPFDGTLVFAGTYNGGVFRSADGGRSWKAAVTGLGDHGAYAPFSTFAFDALRAEEVYAGTSFAGSFRSTDSGLTWSRNALFPVEGSQPLLFALHPDPGSADRLYAATQGGVFLSRDGGRSWRPRLRGLPRSSVLALGFDPAGRELYAGLDAGGVYRSSDRGATWQPANVGLPPRVTALGFDPRSPETVYAGSEDGLYRSLDRGRRWSRVGAAEVRGRVVGIGFLGSAGQLVAATRSVVFTSADRGQSWSPVAGDPQAIPIQGFALGAGTIFVAPFRPAGASGVARSTDGGATWRQESRGLSTLDAQQLAFHPTDPATLYLSTGPTGLFRSVDGGTTWNRVAFAPSQPFFPAFGVAFDPAVPHTVYAGGPLPGALARSDDGGATWSAPNAGLPGFVEVLRADPRTPGGLWAGGNGAALHSSDGGRTWESLPFPSAFTPWILDIEVDADDPRIVTYAGARLIGTRIVHLAPIVVRTEDGGATWRELTGGALGAGFAYQIATGEGAAGTLYAATDAALYRSRNGGASWQPVLDFKGEGGAVALTPEALYAARSGAGILRSTDGGATWTPIRAGFGARRVRHLWADPGNPRHLYAGTTNGGLYEYTEAP